MERFGSRKFIVFLTVAFLSVAGAMSGALTFEQAVEYVGAAGAVYTAAEGAADLIERRREGASS